MKTKTKNRHRYLIFKSINGHEPYCEWTGGGYVSVCYACHFVCKMGYVKPLIYNEPKKCPNCHNISMFGVGITARAPRKSASKAVWNKFWEMFKNGSHPKGCR